MHLCKIKVWLSSFRLEVGLKARLPRGRGNGKRLLLGRTNTEDARTSRMCAAAAWLMAGTQLFYQREERRIVSSLVPFSTKS